MELVLHPRKITRVFIGIGVLLTLAHLAAQISIYVFDHPWVFGLVPLFDLDEERNIPTFFEAASLLICAGLLALIGFAYRKKPGISARTPTYWLGLALIFTFLAFDEAAKIHELSIGPVREALDTSGIFYFAWVIPYAVFLLVFGAAYFRFWLNLPPRTRWLFLLAGAIFVTGAFGLELLGGQTFERLEEQKNVTYAAITTVEEIMEISGIILFLYALLAHVATELGDLRVRIGNHPRGS